MISTRTSGFYRICNTPKYWLSLPDGLLINTIWISFEQNLFISDAIEIKGVIKSSLLQRARCVFIIETLRPCYTEWDQRVEKSSKLWRWAPVGVSTAVPRGPSPTWIARCFTSSLSSPHTSACYKLTYFRTTDRPVTASTSTTVEGERPPTAATVSGRNLSLCNPSPPTEKHLTGNDATAMGRDESNQTKMEKRRQHDTANSAPVVPSAEQIWSTVSSQACISTPPGEWWKNWHCVYTVSAAAAV